MLDFIIIGAQKSASTTIHKSLAGHPDIYMPATESRLFETPDYERDGVARLKAIGDQGGGRLVGIKRPDYFTRPEVPARIREHAPDARLLLTLRHPSKRAISAVFHLMKLGFLPVCPLDEIFRALFAGTLQEKYPKAGEILEYGYYAKHLKGYLELFPSEQILILLDNEIRTDPEGCLKKTLLHLGLSPDWKPDRLRQRSNPGVYSLPRLRFINLRNRMVFDYNQERTRLSRKTGLLGPLCNIAIVGIDRLLLSRCFSNRVPELADDLQRRLLNCYREDTVMLQSMLNKDLAHWRVF